MKGYLASVRSTAALLLHRIAPAFLAHVAYRPHQEAFSRAPGRAAIGEGSRILPKGSSAPSKWLRGWRLQ